MFTPVEHDGEMNYLLRDVTNVLTDAGLSPTWQSTHDPSADQELTLDAGARGVARYLVRVRRGRLDRQAATAMPLPDRRPVLVVAPHVSDAVADVLRTRGADHVDAAGNLRLAWDTLLLDVRGRRRPPTTEPRVDPAASRAFTRSGTQVVFALLSWAEMSARPVREIAAASGTSVGTAHRVLQDLSAAGYLYDAPDGTHLNRGGELLDRWAEAYATTLSRKLHLASFAVDGAGRLGEVESALLTAGAQLGGEVAASRIDAHLRPATVTVYLDRIPAEAVGRLRLRRDDRSGTVHIRRRFWTYGDVGAPLVPSPLVYADLVSSGDPRQREHAERIRGVDDRLVELDRT